MVANISMKMRTMVKWGAIVQFKSYIQSNKLMSPELPKQPDHNFQTENVETLLTQVLTNPPPPLEPPGTSLQVAVSWSLKVEQPWLTTIVIFR